MSSLAKSLQVIALQPFRWFILNCIFANLSSGLTYITMSWLITDKSTSISSLALLMMCFWTPTILLAPFYGLIVDKFSRKWLMIISNGSRAFVLLAMAFIIGNKLNSQTIYASAILLSILGNLYGPAAFSFIREIVQPQQLLHANAMVTLSYELGNVVGMGAAGFFLAVVSIKSVIFISSLLFFLAALALWLIRADKLTPHHPTVHLSWQAILESMRYLMQRKHLIMLYSIQLFLMANYLTAPILIAPFVKHILQASSTEFGIMQGSFSLGMILGGLFAPWWVDLVGITVVSFVKIMAVTLLFLVLSLTNHLSVAIMLYFLIGLCLASWSLIITKAQIMTDQLYQARIQACFNGFSAVIVLMIFILLNLTAEFISIRVLFQLEALIAFLALILLRKVRKFL